MPAPYCRALKGPLAVLPELLFSSEALQPKVSSLSRVVRENQIAFLSALKVVFGSVTATVAA